MKKHVNKVRLGAMLCAVALLLAGCGAAESQSSEALSGEAESEVSTIITDYSWQGSQDGSLLVCEKDGSFKYYRSADDLTDNYFEGTYEFNMGKDAVTYMTTTLGDYGVTEEELEDIFERNEEYDESNFVCLVLHNETCIMDGENQIETPYQTPYFGFCLENEDGLYLDIANMNSGNYYIYLAK